MSKYLVFCWGSIGQLQYAVINHCICVFSTITDWPCCLSLSPCRAAVYQWRAGPHWPWGPSDQRGHSHSLWSHHTGSTHQNTLQHTHLAGRCAECNRLVCAVAMGGVFAQVFVSVLTHWKPGKYLMALSPVCPFALQVTLCPWWTWYLCSRKLWKMNPLSPARWLAQQWG